MINQYILGAILVSALVTWLPRVLPYGLVRLGELPDKVVQFLGYLPITIIFSLILSSVFPGQIGRWPQVQWIELVAVFPTFLVLGKTRNVMLAVLAGVLCVAFLRYLF